MEFFRTFVAAYLISTLSVTALAKLKSWRVSSVGVLRERVIPPSAATSITIAVAVVEFLLATFFMLGTESVVTGVAATVLFLGFCWYQLLVAAKTNSLTCTCAGTIRSGPASPPAVAGTVFASLVQATLACTMAIVGGGPGGILHLLAITAWIIPMIVFLVGLLRRSGRSGIDERFHVEFASQRYDFEEITGGHMTS